MKQEHLEFPKYVANSSLYFVLLLLSQMDLTLKPWNVAVQFQGDCRVLKMPQLYIMLTTALLHHLEMGHSASLRTRVFLQKLLK